MQQAHTIKIGTTRYILAGRAGIRFGRIVSGRLTLLAAGPISLMIVHHAA